MLCLGLPSLALSLPLLLPPGSCSSKHLGLRHLQCAAGASALVSKGAKLQESLPQIFCLIKTVQRAMMDGFIKGEIGVGWYTMWGKLLGSYHEGFLCVMLFLLFLKATNSLSITQNFLAHHPQDGINLLFQTESCSVTVN